MAMDIKWSDEKNEWLKRERGLAFEMVAAAIEEKRILKDVPHPVRLNQRIMVFESEADICVVPYVLDGTTRFLKTMYRSRKLRKERGLS
jgi:uncharacterized DUF497 family protein